MFSLLGLVLVLRGSRVVMEHHHQQMATHPNNFQEEMPNLLGFFNDIHVFFVLFWLPTYPTFPPGPPEQQQINLAWPKYDRIYEKGPLQAEFNFSV